MRLSCLDSACPPCVFPLKFSILCRPLLMRGKIDHKESNMQRQKKSKCALWILLGAQVAMVMGFYAGGGALAAWSALVGGGSNTVGQVYFLLKTLRSNVVLTPKAALYYFYRTELFKMALIFSVLMLLLVLFKLNVWIVFVTFVAAQCIGSFAPLCAFKQRRI